MSKHWNELRNWLINNEYSLCNDSTESQMAMTTVLEKMREIKNEETGDIR